MDFVVRLVEGEGRGVSVVEFGAQGRLEVREPVVAEAIDEPEDGGRADRGASGRQASVQCAIPSAYDADLYLTDSSGSTLERSVNDGAGTDESLSFTRTATGTYYLDVEAYSGSGTASCSCVFTKN
ncbi:PPC domain-containing protein [Streptomyces sp. NPDC057094]|uniref:PPC domain-containing protein n=1 Tax=Streptomyces sp. NPDC057094 TaxID=3346018 RepID=UPI003643C514